MYKYEYDFKGKRYNVTIRENGYREVTYPNSEIYTLAPNFIHFTHKNKEIVFSGNVVIKVEKVISK